MPQNRKFENFVENKYLGNDQPKHLVFLYDFATLGGAVGAIVLTNADGKALTLPDNAILTSVLYEELTPLASGGSATVALGITGNTDAFLSATAFNDAEFTTDVSTKNAEIPLKLDGSKSVVATVAVAALTAGKFKLYVEYIEGTA